MLEEEKADEPLHLMYHQDWCFLAVQGPEAMSAIAATFPAAPDLAFMRCMETEYHRRPVIVTRSGYTGEIGYEPAGIFTPDLREVDHYRYHDKLLPQVIGHTASKHGEIRYSPGSWLQRDYIAIDVGRQHGTGNGGLLLTDFGWVAIAPGRAARLVEAGPLFVRLAHEAAAG